MEVPQDPRELGWPCLAGSGFSSCSKGRLCTAGPAEMGGDNKVWNASSPMLMAVISFIVSQREKKKGKQKGSAGWIDRRRG